MRKLVNSVICIVLVVVTVIGLTTSSAKAQQLLAQSNLSSNTVQAEIVTPNNENTGNSANSCSTVECQPGIQYYPNPNELTSFCQCSNGVPYYQPCPAGLNFNPTLNVCDDPQNVMEVLKAAASKS